MKRQCSNCDYVGTDRVPTIGGSHEWDGQLVCRRYPPRVIMDGGMNPISKWPRVTDEDRCGEFMQKKEPPS